MRAPIAFALAACLCALPARGVEKWVVERWSKELDTTATLLKEGKHGEALPRLKKLTGEMVEVFGPGDQAAQAFGIVVVQRALAEAGLGHRDDALWYWHVALGIDPRFAKSDLSVFGEAGRLLKASPVPASHPELVGPPSPFIEARRSGSASRRSTRRASRRSGWKATWSSRSCSARTACPASRACSSRCPPPR